MGGVQEGGGSGITVADRLAMAEGGANQLALSDAAAQVEQRVQELGLPAMVASKFVEAVRGVASQPGQTPAMRAEYLAVIMDNIGVVVDGVVDNV